MSFQVEYFSTHQSTITMQWTPIHGSADKSVNLNLDALTLFLLLSVAVLLHCLEASHFLIYSFWTLFYPFNQQRIWFSPFWPSLLCWVICSWATFNPWCSSPQPETTLMWGQPVWLNLGFCFYIPMRAVYSFYSCSRRPWLLVETARIFWCKEFGMRHQF